MSDHYDVAVLGGQPAGFLTAALLAKRGLRTVLIDHGEGFDSYRQGGVTYPLIPQPMIGLRGNRLIDLVLTELGAQVDFPRRYQETPISFQTIYPSHRLNLGAGGANWAKEVAREFPADVESTKQVLEAFGQAAETATNLLLEEEAMPLPSWWGRYFQRRRIEQRQDLAVRFGQASWASSLSQPMKDLLLQSSHFFSNFNEQDPPVAALGLLANQLMRGTMRVEGMAESYLDALQKLVQNAGGVVHRGTPADRLLAQGGKLTGIEAAHGRQNISADFFVHALYSTELFKTLPSSRTLNAFSAEQANLRGRGKLFIHHLLIKQRGVPLGLAENALLLNGRHKPRDDGEAADTAVWLTLRPNHTKDHALLSALVLVNENEATSLPEQLAYQRNRVKKQIERLMPFLKPFIVAESSPMSPSEWDAADPPFARKLDTWALHPVFEPVPGSLLGITGLGFQTPYKNLFRVGREVFPGLGQLGDYATAWMASTLIKKARQK